MRLELHLAAADTEIAKGAIVEHGYLTPGHGAQKAPEAPLVLSGAYVQFVGKEKAGGRQGG